MKLPSTSRLIVFSPILALALVATCQLMLGRDVIANAKGNDQTIINKLEHEWINALKTHDYAWFERNFAGDCTEVSSGDGSIKSKAQDIADFRADKSVFETVEFEDLRIRVEGIAAIANGITHIKGKDEQDQPFDVRLRFTDTWIKRSGRWQVWAAQHTRIRP